MPKGEKNKSFKISNKEIENSKPHPERKPMWDSGAPGLHFRPHATEKGRGGWYIKYRLKTGKQRRWKFADYPETTLAEARDKAKQIVGEVASGRDPKAALPRPKELDRPTVADLWEWFEKERLPKKRPSTQTEYESMWRVYIEPSLGSMMVAEVRYEDIELLHRTITNGKHKNARQPSPYRANRVHAVLHHIFKLAVAPKKWRTDNPATGVERNKEEKRERYLEPDELQRLLAALDAEENRTFADLFMLALLTGARVSEPKLARWENVDLENAIWTKPQTKQGRPHIVALSPIAAALLQALRERQITRAADEGREPSEWVFEGDRPNKHIASYHRVWKRICERAGIEDFRVHDLRHSAASMLVTAGYSLPQIGAQLGHKSAQTTLRYAHLMEEGKRAIADGIEKGVFGSAKEPEDPTPSNVVRIR